MLAKTEGLANKFPLGEIVLGTEDAMSFNVMMDLIPF